VVQLSGDRLTYARALASLEEHRLQTPAFGLAADGGDLLARVRRLLGAPVEKQRSSAAVALAILMALPFFLLGEMSGSAEGRTGTSIATVQVVPADSPRSLRMPGVVDPTSGRIVPIEITRGLAAVGGRLAAMGQQSDAPRETRPEGTAPEPPASPVQVSGARPQAKPASAAEADAAELARLLELANRHVNAGRFGEAGRVLEQMQSLLERMPAGGARRVGGQSENVTVGGAPPPPPPPPLAGPSATTAAPFRVGGAVAPPVKIRDVPPVYPPDARAARVQGVVILEAVISADGLVRDLKVLRGNPMLDAAAVEAVRQWEYTPPMLGGQPVDVIMTVTVNFTLN
jgi:protein TonB